MVEKGTAQRRTPTIVWLTYGGQLIRAAPEHLRAASNLECRVEDLIRGQTIRPGQVIQGLKSGGLSKFIDLGVPPTNHERAQAEEEDVPNHFNNNLNLNLNHHLQ